MALAIVIPCLIWFIRNLYRDVTKKDYWWMNKFLKISWLIGLVVFVTGFILLIVKLKRNVIMPTSTNKEQEQKSVSVVDEFNQNKRIVKKLKFKSKDVEYVWQCFLTTFKKTFKIQRDLELGLKFSLKIGGIFSNYEIETFDLKNIYYKLNELMDMINTDLNFI